MGEAGSSASLETDTLPTGPTGPTDSNAPALRHGVILCVGLLACSTSVIFIKLTTMHPVLLSAFRLAVAVVVLLPLYMRDARRLDDGPALPRLLRTIVPGLLLGMHFVTWIIGARMTPVVNSTLIVNMVPMVTPALLLVFVSERVNRREWLGTMIAIGGASLLCLHDYRFAPKNFAGDAMCFGSMLLFAGYMVLGRRNRDFPSIWLYVVPVYFWAGLACFAASFAFVDPFAGGHTGRELWLATCLGLVPTVIGHSAMNHSLKHFRGQLVSVASLSQTILAGILAFLLLSEVPHVLFYPAALMVAAGVAVTVMGTPDER